MPGPIVRVPLPDELNYLIHLQSSFLSALSFHYAHNGTAAPVDLRELTPSMTRLYRKRQVTAEDVRICLGIQQEISQGAKKATSHGDKRFKLYDYGRGRVCLEIEGKSKAKGILDKQVDEERLLEGFTKTLEKTWQKWITTQGDASQDVSESESPNKRKRGVDTEDADEDSSSPQKRRKGEDGRRKSSKQAPTVKPTALARTITSAPISSFVASLPRAPILMNASAAFLAANPPHAIGATRLAMLKTPAKAAAASTQPSQPKVEADSKPVSTSTPISRRSNLLDRILAKKQQSMPEISPAQSSRLTALSRVLEIHPIIILALRESSARSNSSSSSSSALNSRSSMSLSALTQQIQQSVRVPMGKDEVRECLDVVAEITNGQVMVVKSEGGVDGGYITVNWGIKMARKELESCIQSKTEQVKQKA